MNVFTRRGVDAAFASKAGRIADSVFPVANRIFFPNELPDASLAYVLSQTHHLLYDDVFGVIRIQWPNLRATTGYGAVVNGAREIAAGAAATATANVTYIDRTTKRPVTVDLVDRTTGSTNLTAPDGGLFDAVATIDARRGDRIVPKIAAHFPNGMMYGQGQADIAGGDLLQYGSAAIPLSTTPVNTYAGNRGYYGPCSIRSATQIGSWGVCGDSRNSPLADVANDLYGDIGQVRRLIGRRLPVVDISVPGETAADFASASQSPVRRSLLRQARSGVFMMLGTNDIIFQGQTAAATKARLDQIAADLGMAQTAIYGTIDPATAGGITTPARPATESARTAFNTTIRALTRKFDPACVMESAATPGAWASASYVSSDYVHETSVGNQAAAGGSGFDFGLVGSPSIVDAGFAYPSGALYQSLGFADGWSSREAILTSGALYSPEHRITAAAVKEDGAAADHYIYKQLTLPIAGATRTFSVFAKRVTGSRNLMLQVQRTNEYSDGRLVADLGSGSVMYSYSAAPSIVIQGSSITAFDDYYQLRLSLTFASGSNADPYVILKLVTGPDSSESYMGDGASSLALWGLQVS